MSKGKPLQRQNRMVLFPGTTEDYTGQFHPIKN